MSHVKERAEATIVEKIGSQGPDEAEDLGVDQKLSNLIEQDVSLEDPLVALALTGSDFVDFAFWTRDSKLMERAAALVRGDITYDKVIRDGWWSRAWTWLNNFDFESEHTSAPDQRLPIAEIHSPNIEGCAASFAKTQSGAITVAIKAFGIGYQRIKRIGIKRSYEVEAQCGLLTTGVQIVVRALRNKFTGDLRALVRLINIDGTIVGQPLPPNLYHPCGPDYASAKARVTSITHAKGQMMGENYASLPMRNEIRKAKATEKMELETGTVYNADLDLPIVWSGGAPISNLSLKFESTITRTIQLEWNLIGGHDYLRYRGVRDDMRMFWAWD
jgi:hypothetical protein